MSDWNDTVITEFRAGNERIADRFSRDSLLLLHTTGARSGLERVSPVACFTHGGQIFVVASAAGRPDNPAWYANLTANPQVSIEIWQDGELRTLTATAATLQPAERAPAWAMITAEMPGFADYQTTTDRVIPVVELTPA